MQQIKSVVITTSNQPKNKIAGMSNIKVDNNKFSFMFSGDLNKLILYISMFELKNIEVCEPTLEEIFMHYYE